MIVFHVCQWLFVECATKMWEHLTLMCPHWNAKSAVWGQILRNCIVHLKHRYIVIFLMIQHCTNYQFQMQCSKISLTQQAPCLLFKKKRRLRWLLLWVQFCKLFRLCKLLLPQTVFYTFLYWFKVAMTMLTIIRFIILHCEVVLYMTLFTCFLLIKVHFILLPFFFFTN